MSLREKQYYDKYRWGLNSLSRLCPSFYAVLIQMPALGEYVMTYEVDSEPVVCTKCDNRSNTEIENKIHYHIKHKAVNDKYNNENW